MNILLTNDDGYNHQGILTLKPILEKFAKVTIVAPKTGMSASSCSKILNRPLRLREESRGIYSLDGTPADCVAFGLTTLGIKFDLVVSGCNDGLNLANDILYSGTIGACVEALTYEVPAIAVSCDSNFELVQKKFEKVFSLIIDKDYLSPRYLLNVNFPKGDKVKAIELGKVYYRKDNNYFTKIGNDTYQAKRDPQKTFLDPHTDCYQADHGIVSITPLDRHLFNDEIYHLLKNL